MPRHDGIATLKNPESPEKRVWMLADKPPCRSLAERLATDGPMSLTVALEVFRQVAGMLQYVHGHGLMHGVVHPELIFCDDEQRCFIGMADGSGEADAGLFHEQLARWSLFLAPEQDPEAPPDSRHDVYSLGVLLHWLLTGRAPNGAGVSTRIPHALAETIAAAVQKSPARRLQTITAFTDAVDAFSPVELARMEEELRLAMHSGGFDPRLIWARHPRKVLAAAAMLLVLLCLGYWGLHKYEQRRVLQAKSQKEAADKVAKLEAYRDRYTAANDAYTKGQYVDAIEGYAEVAGRDLQSELTEASLAQIARANGKLKDFGAEYTSWLRLLREFPETAHSGEANERIIRIAALTVTRFGDLVDITTQNDILIDGLPYDWEGIDAIILDPEGDNRKGGGASDLIRFYAAVKGDTIFFRFDTLDTPSLGDQYCTALDLNAFAYDDSVEEWDYQIGVARGIAPWIWDLRGRRNYENSKSRKLHGVVFAQKACVEVSIPLSALGNPSSLGLRPFINMEGLRTANDVCQRKVLVRWTREEIPASSDLVKGSEF